MSKTTYTLVKRCNNCFHMNAKKNEFCSNCKMYLEKEELQKEVIERPKVKK